MICHEGSRTTKHAKKLFALLQLALLAVLSVGFAQSAAGQGRKASADLGRQLDQTQAGTLSQDGAVDVIIQFVGTPGTRHFNKVSAQGGRMYRNFDTIRGGHFNVSRKGLAQLANDPDIAYISLDRTIEMKSTDHFVQSVGADWAQNNGWNGAGFSVAVIDSGISSHSDLKDANGVSRVVYNESFVTGESPADLYGHGTHVAGIIAGNGTSSSSWQDDPVKGVAPSVNLVNLKVLDKNGSGNDSAVIAAIQRAIALKNTYKIKAINLSLGRGIFESYTLDPLDQAVESAYRAGIVVVVSAGNDGRNNTSGINGYATINSPGNDPYVITVGAVATFDTATTSDDKVDTYSSKGPTWLDHVVKPDLVAPGNHMISLMSSGSTLANSLPNNWVYSWTTGAYSYLQLSGTSMSAPVVTGTVVLLLQKTPGLSPDTIKARLMKTASKSFPAGYTWYDSTENINRYNQQDIFAIGAGYLNIPAALSSTDTLGQPAASPVAVAKSDGSIAIASSISGNSLVWGNSQLWGNSLVWGSNVLSSNSLVWGSSLVWGQNMTKADSLIWGSSLVWGSSTDTRYSQALSVIWGH